MATNQDSVRDVYLAFATYGTRQPDNLMENKNWVKLCKDCGFIGKGFTVTDADLIFSKVKPKGSRKITFDQFLEAVRQTALRKNVTLAELERAILACPGPVTMATKPDYVKFHDDKNTWCGVYARGGPTNVDQKPYLFTYRT